MLGVPVLRAAGPARLGLVVSRDMVAQGLPGFAGLLTRRGLSALHMYWCSIGRTDPRAHGPTRRRVRVFNLRSAWGRVFVRRVPGPRGACLHGYGRVNQRGCGCVRGRGCEWRAGSELGTGMRRRSPLVVVCLTG